MAKFGSTPSELEIPAGAVVARNAGDSGFEAIVPTTLTAVKADVDIADALTKKHANTLDHSNANDPAAGEKAALAGTSGTPGTSNKFVTNADARNTDARDPKAHDQAISTITGLQSALDGKLATTVFSGLTKITVGTTAPSSPNAGDLFVDTN